MSAQKLILFFVCIAMFDVAVAANDMPGSRDHPKIPRIDGSAIFGFQFSEFDEGKFATLENGASKTLRPTGKRTRILYLAPRNLTVPGVIRNYQVALQELGDVEEHYSCRSDCGTNAAAGFVWELNNRIPTTLKGDQYLYEVWTNVTPHVQKDHKDQGYWYATVTTSDARYHVSVYTAELTNGGLGTYRTEPDSAGTRSIHLEVLEEADFEPTLTTVTPEEITKGIAEEGKIALYGIYFDFDSDALKPESSEALEAIAAALKADGSLKVYVVGHTDNAGDYEYNRGLSERRAASVVNTLTGKYSINAARLTPVGVGPAAPVASNRSEDGRALNRRVELVEI